MKGPYATRPDGTHNFRCGQTQSSVEATRLDIPRLFKLASRRVVVDSLITRIVPRHCARIRCALHVVLPAQRIESRALAAYVAGEQCEMDKGHSVVGAVRVLGNTEGPVNRCVLCRRIHPRRLNDEASVDAGNRLSIFRRELFDRPAEILEAFGAPLDEILVI